MGRARYIILVALATLGGALSGYLVWQHAHFLFTGQKGALCELVQRFDCSKIENSAFSELLGIPTASFGLFFFLMFLGYLIGFRSDGPPQTTGESAFWRGAAALNAVGVAVSIALGSISAFVIKSLCIGCVLVYTINLLMLLSLIPWPGFWRYPMMVLRGAVGFVPHALTTFRVGEERQRTRAKLTLIFLALAAVVNFYAVPKFISTERMRIIIMSYEQMPVVEIPVHPWSMSKGEASAPLQIVQFTDFLCPTCRRASNDLAELLADYDPASYRVVYKHFPLDRKCNRLVAEQGPDFNIHAGACEMALLAQGAGSMGGFWKAVDLFYAMQDYAGHGSSDAESMKIWIGDLVAATGLEEKAWLDFARSGVNQQRILSDIEDGARLQVIATPAIFINGRRAPGTKRPDLQAVLDHVTAQ